MMKTFPRWVTLLFVAFMGFMLYQGTRPAPVEAPVTSAITPAITEKTYPTLRALTDGNRWAKAINPDYKNPDDACNPPASDERMLGNYAIIEKAGTDHASRCGERADLRVTLFDARGNPLPEQELYVTLGEQPAFDALVVGMQVGEVRLLMLRLPAKVKTLPMIAAGKTQLIRVYSNGIVLD